MKVMKFGGSSIGTPERAKNVINIIKEVAKNNVNVAVVLSAFGKSTDQLIEMSRTAGEGNTKYVELLQSFSGVHSQYITELVEQNREIVQQNVNQSFKELKDILHGIFLVKELSARTLDFVMSFGERLSCFVVSEALRGQVDTVHYLDSREVIKTDEKFGAARVNFDLTNKYLKEYFESHTGLNIVTGFLGFTENSETTTLGRGGSDYTASIVAAALNANEVEIWTDVDGVMTADPRKVPKAFSIDSLTYEEAMEMSHFGANVIHPPTMQPALNENIPIKILNTFNRAFAGSKISDNNTPGSNLVKSVTSIPEVALFRVQGSGMFGVTGTAMRVFGTLAREGINIILITQASSEHSICFAVAPNDSVGAKKIIEEEFSLEIETKQIGSPIVETDLSVIAVVGENMHRTPGISGRLFQALGKNGINVITIAQGSSELNISVVVPKEDEVKALNAIHDSFFLSETRSINMFMVGTGLVGGTLLKQLIDHYQFLKNNRQIELKLVALTNTRKNVFNADGIIIEEWQKLLDESEEETILDSFINNMIEQNLPNSVFIDCTSSDDIIKYYKEILNESISIVTANKKANSGSFELYSKLKTATSRSGAKFLYETNVGAGLPVISTLNDLRSSGDKILKIEAILSGTLSYIFNSFGKEKSFSEVVYMAMKTGYTEPDPRDDLNGLDVARKLLILGREIGLSLELNDIKVENLVPENCRNIPTIEKFFEEFEKVNAGFENRRVDAEKEGKVLRYIATLENGDAQVTLQAVGSDHPFYNLSGSDNIISFKTDRYHDRPLVIKGPGAGAEVTAAGMFADIIRILN
ncbi:MAG: bifunctional aspartate kinase/homoserine dehydrogenase I [Ignavibacterium sp.]|nr:MAG: bifunctional aspartate kinase/homoserine dehydrogenase I [Ignavibacterium sp.]